MIKTVVTISCDVDGCGATTDLSEEPLAHQLPPGWASLIWLAPAPTKPDEPREKYIKAVRKLKTKLPPQEGEYVDAMLAVSDALLPSVPQLVQCKAIVCPHCLDQINLNDFATGY